MLNYPLLQQPASGPSGPSVSTESSANLNPAVTQPYQQHQHQFSGYTAHQSASLLPIKEQQLMVLMQRQHQVESHVRGPQISIQNTVNANSDDNHNPSITTLPAIAPPSFPSQNQYNNQHQYPYQQHQSQSQHLYVHSTQRGGPSPTGMNPQGPSSTVPTAPGNDISVYNQMMNQPFRYHYGYGYQNMPPPHGYYQPLASTLQQPQSLSFIPQNGTGSSQDITYNMDKSTKDSPQSDVRAQAQSQLQQQPQQYTVYPVPQQHEFSQDQQQQPQQQPQPQPQQPAPMQSSVARHASIQYQQLGSPASITMPQGYYTSQKSQPRTQLVGQQHQHSHQQTHPSVHCQHGQSSSSQTQNQTPSTPSHHPSYQYRYTGTSYTDYNTSSNPDYGYTLSDRRYAVPAPPLVSASMPTPLQQQQQQQQQHQHTISVSGNLNGFYNTPKQEQQQQITQLDTPELSVDTGISGGSSLSVVQPQKHFKRRYSQYEDTDTNRQQQVTSDGGSSHDIANDKKATIAGVVYNSSAVFKRLKPTSTEEKSEALKHFATNRSQGRPFSHNLTGRFVHHDGLTSLLSQVDKKNCNRFVVYDMSTKCAATKSEPQPYSVVGIDGLSVDKQISQTLMESLRDGLSNTSAGGRMSIINDKLKTEITMEALDSFLDTKHSDLLEINGYKDEITSNTITITYNPNKAKTTTASASPATTVVDEKPTIATAVPTGSTSESKAGVAFNFHTLVKKNFNLDKYVFVKTIRDNNGHILKLETIKPPVDDEGNFEYTSEWLKRRICYPRYKGGMNFHILGPEFNFVLYNDLKMLLWDIKEELLNRGEEELNVLIDSGKPLVDDLLKETLFKNRTVYTQTLDR